MDKINNYKQIIQKAFEYQASKFNHPLPYAGTRVYIGENKNHFILMDIGWKGKIYLHRILYTVEIINDKIWIHEDNTDTDLIGKLLDAGIPKKDIVLGFVPLYAREIEGFAMG
ncbi:MAG: element excision factor XisI family protein [Chitinophagales bacterium]